VSRIRNKTFYLQFCMETPEGIEFAGWIQNPKNNYWNTKSINQNKKFRKKTTLKVERGQKYARTKFVGSTQNPNKKYQNIKSTKYTGNFPKKSMFSTLKLYRSQKFVWRLPDGIRLGSLKNNRTQVTFRKP
jgi:hypothetical protein